MEINCTSPSLLGSGWGRKGRLLERQSIGLMLNCSSTNTPDGIFEGPHCPIILHSMFLHATEEGQKEAERFIHWGQWQGLPRLDPKADIPTIQLVGYQTSQKEIQDLYHEVYLIRRSPGPLLCRPQCREEPIQDILSSLRSHLQRWGGTAMLEEDQWGAAVATSQPIHQLELQSRSQGETVHMMRPSERPERLTHGHWRLPTCWNWILKDWARE